MFLGYVKFYLWNTFNLYDSFNSYEFIKAKLSLFMKITKRNKFYPFYQHYMSSGDDRHNTYFTRLDHSIEEERWWYSPLHEITSEKIQQPFKLTVKFAVLNALDTKEIVFWLNQQVKALKINMGKENFFSKPYHLIISVHTHQKSNRYTQVY